MCKYALGQIQLQVGWPHACPDVGALRVVQRQLEGVSEHLTDGGDGWCYKDRNFAARVECGPDGSRAASGAFANPMFGVFGGCAAEWALFDKGNFLLGKFLDF